jgi:hypothetical protein
MLLGQPEPAAPREAEPPPAPAAPDTAGTKAPARPAGTPRRAKSKRATRGRTPVEETP